MIGPAVHHCAGAVFLGKDRLSWAEAYDLALHTRFIWMALADHHKITRPDDVTLILRWRARVDEVEAAVNAATKWRRTAGYDPIERFDDIGTFHGSIRLPLPFATA